jgi:hypothetical protein
MSFKIASTQKDVNKKRISTKVFLTSLDKFLALPKNIRLCRKALPGTNSLAYLSRASVTQ